MGTGFGISLTAGDGDVLMLSFSVAEMVIADLKWWIEKHGCSGYFPWLNL